MKANINQRMGFIAIAALAACIGNGLLLAATALPAKAVVDAKGDVTSTTAGFVASASAQGGNTYLVTFADDLPANCKVEADLTGRFVAGMDGNGTLNGTPMKTINYKMQAGKPVFSSNATLTRQGTRQATVAVDIAEPESVSNFGPPPTRTPTGFIISCQ